MHHLSPENIATFMKRFSLIEGMSIEDVEAAFADLDLPYEVTPTGRRKEDLGTTVSHRTIGDLQVVCSRWGAPMKGASLGDQGVFSIGIPISGATELIDPHFGRINTKPCEARMFRPGAGARLVGQGPRTVMDLVLPYKLLQARARSFHDMELNAPLRFAPVLNLQSRGGKLLLNLIEHVNTLVIHEPGAAENPLVTNNLQEHILSTVLELLPHNYKEARTAKVDCVVPRTVRLAEEYMHAFADQPVTVEALARHAGCSERALHYAFKSFRSASPMTVLRDIRLDGAHNDLRRGETTITDIVFKWGFSNLGRFSKLYVERFGRKPSETKRLHAQ